MLLFKWSLYASIKSSIDFVNPLDYKLTPNLGVEYSFDEMIFVRAGSHMGHDTAGLTFGFGLSYNNINLDFGWADYAILESTWQLGLSFGF